MITLCSRSLSSLTDFVPLPSQTVIALDLYLAYLRAAFNTCYYCAVITDHVEELQRKCVKHLRKPMSKMLLQEVQAAEASKAEKDPKVEEGSDAQREKDAQNAKEKSENRDWKRNGTYNSGVRHSWDHSNLT